MEILAHYEQLSLFAIMFSKVFCCRSFKMGLQVVLVLTNELVMPKCNMLSNRNKLLNVIFYTDKKYDGE